MPPLTHYDRLADLFDYPDTEYPARVERARAALAASYSSAAARLEAFAAALPERTAELQEIFTRTFDVQAVTTLSVGYLLFGDDYKRGELLSHLRREQDVEHVDTGVELPDHLPNVLRLIARWENRELAAELVDEIVRPAVLRMIAEFGQERMARRDRLYEKHFRTLIASAAGRATMFRDPLAAMAMVLDEDFEPPPPAARPATAAADFLQAISVELDIEAGKSS